MKLTLHEILVEYANTYAIPQQVDHALYRRILPQEEECMETNYREWVEKAKRHDKEAITALYNATKDHAYFITKQYVKKEATCMDVLQDSYIKAFQHLDQLDDGKNFEKWFHCIVANTSKDYIKKKKPLLFSDIAEDKEMEWVDDRIEFSPVASLDQKELQTFVMQIIDTLSIEQKVCVLLYYYDECSIKEIAQALEISDGTVKSRLNYARKHIKDEVLHLEKQGIQLRSVSILPLYIWFLQQEAKNVFLPVVCNKGLFRRVEKGKLVKGHHMFVHGHAISSMFIKVSTVVLLVCAAVGAFAYMEMTKFTLIIVPKENIVLEYGDTLREQDVIATVNEEPCPAIDEHIVAIEDKKISLTLNYDAYQIGEQKGQITAQYDEESIQFEFTYHIEDTKAPELKLSEETVELEVNEDFEPEAYIETASDPVDGDLKDAVEIDNPVDMETAGDYEVLYTVKDHNGLSTSAALQVRVVEKAVSVGTAPAPRDKQSSKTQQAQASSVKYTAGLQPRTTGYTGLDQRIDAILGSIVHNGMSNEQKIRAIHDWIGANTTYGYGSYDQSALGSFNPPDERAVLHQGLYRDAGSVLFGGVGVCDHYAAAFEVLAERIGFDVVREGGQVTNADGSRNGHMWNRILLNGSWYYIDTQGDDFNNQQSYYYYLLPTPPSTISGNFDFYRQIDQISSFQEFQNLTGIPIVDETTIVDHVANQYMQGAESSEVILMKNHTSVELEDVFDWYEFCDQVDQATNTTDHMSVDYWMEGSATAKYAMQLGLSSITFVFEH